MNENNDMLLEKKLKKLNPELLSTYRKILKYVFNKLELYHINFPDYSDHSLLHSQRVINYSNILYDDIIDNLNADEIFLYLIACCTHDLGMGIDKLYFAKNVNKILDSNIINDTDFFLTESVIRKYHNFISSYILRTDEDFKNILSDEYIDIVAKLCIAHRSVDLYNKELFPQEIKLSNGNTVKLTLLACMLRLADNLDVGNARINKTRDFYFRIWFFSALSIELKELNSKKITLSVDISMVPLHKNTEINALFEEYTYCKKAFLDLCNYSNLPEKIELVVVYDKDNKRKAIEENLNDK